MQTGPPIMVAVRTAVTLGIVGGAVVLGVAPLGCTVFSGWGDLQGGHRDAGATTASDAEPQSAGDGSTNARCTVAGCAPRICCVHKDGTSGCVDSCTEPGSNQINCTTSSDCTGDAVCCIGSSGATGWQASCTATCVTGLIACNPAEANSCPAPKKCQDPQGGDAGSFSGTWFFSFCQ